MPPTAAGPTVAANGQLDYEVAAQEAMALISYPWQQRLPGWTIEFGPRAEGMLGLTSPSRRTISIFVRIDDGSRGIAHVIAHEIGHAIDVTRFDDSHRQRWRDARGVGPDVPWSHLTRAGDYGSLSGDWAEAFAVAQVGVRSRSTVGGQPGPAELTVARELAG